MLDEDDWRADETDDESEDSEDDMIPDPFMFGLRYDDVSRLLEAMVDWVVVTGLSSQSLLVVDGV